MSTNDTATANMLMDYATAEPIRPATHAEWEASVEAGPAGVIEVDGRACYVEGEVWAS